MKHVLILVVLLTLMPSLSHGQPASYPVIGSVDVPVANAVVRRNDLFVAGWVFNCTRGGQQPYGLHVVLEDFTGKHVQIVGRWTALHRPDVQSYFLPWCSDMSAFTGYHLYFSTPPPVGSWLLIVEWADSYGTHYDQIPITIIK